MMVFHLSVHQQRCSFSFDRCRCLRTRDDIHLAKRYTTTKSIDGDALLCCNVAAAWISDVTRLDLKERFLRGSAREQ